MPDEPGKSSSQILVRKLSTILSADVAEFSRLMGEDEEQTLKTFRGHKKVFESLVAMHRGRIFNTAGDAILAEFASAVEAVRCATDIQGALRTRNDQLPPSRQVRFRMGINLGDVMEQGQDLMGDGVNVAARLQTAAEPGGVCISGSVHDQVRNKLSLSFHSLGEKSYKNIQQPVRTFSITEAEGAGALPAAAPQGAGGGAAKWIVAGVVLLVAVLGAGGYWAYTVSQRSKATVVQAPPITPAPPPEAPAPAAAKPAAEEPEGAPSAQTPSAAAPPAGKAVAAAGAAHEAKPYPSAKRSAGLYDGVYSGAICYAETRKFPRRCVDREGTLSGEKITGQWLEAPEAHVTMFLTGDVSPSGDVRIEMHSEKPDGTVVVSIDLAGTLHDGLIDASGSFRKGRPATLQWRKTGGTSH
ncbi:MAG TPA: adenylate/guanylate cyclase domain-containing protein [Candidatus Aquilonibacter sp.]|nr:adenylate/guanylate cyclase domain-containing protein [Candidatus Aquilonibacter sp.]